MIKQKEQLNWALTQAVHAHRGLVNKSGMPYILHILAVISRVRKQAMDSGRQPTDLEIIVAALHDIVEDTSVTLDEIRNDFGIEVADAVDAITHREEETYEAYIDRLSFNPTAVTVKLADLEENLWMGGVLPFPAPDIQAKLTSRYRAAQQALGVGQSTNLTQVV